MEDRKFCPLCYCLADTAMSPGTLMCEKRSVCGGKTEIVFVIRQ